MAYYIYMAEQLPIPQQQHFFEQSCTDSLLWHHLKCMDPPEGLFAGPENLSS